MTGLQRVCVGMFVLGCAVIVTACGIDIWRVLTR